MTLVSDSQIRGGLEEMIVKSNVRIDELHNDLADLMPTADTTPSVELVRQVDANTSKVIPDGF